MSDLRIPEELIALQRVYDDANRAVAAFAAAHPDGLGDEGRPEFLALVRAEAVAVRDLHRHPLMGVETDRVEFVAALRGAARVGLAA